MRTDHAPSAVASPGAMFFSAAVFGLFGFYMFSGNQSQLLFDLVVWSLRGGAIGFAVAGVLALLRVPMAEAFYLLVSAVTAVLFAVTGIGHLVDPAVGNFNGLLLLLFAAWNGWGTWEGIRAMRAAPPGAGDPGPAGGGP
ncbi:MAG: hypothetical protein ACYTG1_12100 [Planctomycetota bacterium]|jgi:hypothetical protein